MVGVSWYYYSCHSCHIQIPTLVNGPCQSKTSMVSPEIWRGDFIMLSELFLQPQRQKSAGAVSSRLDCLVRRKNLFSFLGLRQRLSRTLPELSNPVGEDSLQGVQINVYLVSSTHLLSYFNKLKAVDPEVVGMRRCEVQGRSSWDGRG
jgi:hypothetical protein